MISKNKIMINFKKNNVRLYNLLLKVKDLKDITGVFIAKKSRIKINTRIGCGTRINGKILIKGAGKVDIGKYCAIGEDVKIISSNHNMKLINLQLALQKKIGSLKMHSDEKIDVIIDNNVWIGDSVIVLAGVHIGNGAILAAGSVVTKNVPAYGIVGGVPAKFIKSRFSQDKIDEIEQSEWWNWSIEKMKNRHPFFD
jgi:virginiamycin A acetyltransferase